MGLISTEQTVRIIESVGEAVASQPQPVIVPEQHWWQVFAIVGTTVASLLTGWATYVAVKRRQKNND